MVLANVKVVLAVKSRGPVVSAAVGVALVVLSHKGREEVVLDRWERPVPVAVPVRRATLWAWREVVLVREKKPGAVMLSRQNGR